MTEKNVGFSRILEFGEVKERDNALNKLTSLITLVEATYKSKIIKNIA